MNRLVGLFFAWGMAWGQSPAPNGVIRIDVNLVQVDAVVTDSKDRRVANLQAEDFEIRQDGKPQTITNFSYVSTKPEAAHRAAPAKPVKGEPPPPPAPPDPAEIRRTLALVVDDLGLAAENIAPVREAIRNFIDEQMRPGDLVAIIRTSAGMGALQQFTTDKRLLEAALDRVRYVQSRVGVSSFTPLAPSGRGGRGGRGGDGDGGFNRYREETMTVGSLGAIRFVVNSMRGLPGRKSLVLFTEDIRLMYQRAPDEVLAGALQELNDAASRALVVIHTVDPRGVVDYSPTSADNTSNMPARRISRVPAQREQQAAYTQQGGAEVAEESGGLFLAGNNDLAGAVREAAEDSDGYYLIGYHPDADTFETRDGQPKFHKIDVKVKGSGLRVRSRDGFFGAPGGSQPVEHTREAELNQALQSPFAAGAIHPRLTAVFTYQRGSGPTIDGLLYFDAKELQWSSEPDGSHKAAIDVAAAAYDEDGLALAPIDTTFAVRLNPREYDKAMREGMVYDIHVPVAKPGPYQVRAAVRDAATEGSGAAAQYVEVPDVDSGRLALSGIVLQGGAGAANGDVARQGPAPGEDVTSAAARRSFRRGAELLYGYEVINAKAGADQRPDLEVQTRLFHDGEQVRADKTALTTAGAAPNPRRLTAPGRVELGRDMTPGEYVLQVTVTDKLAKSKFNTATQSMDFEIEP
jgi:VWFA-related protein